MANQSTSTNGPATTDALIDAYIAGMQRGFVMGAVATLTPAAKDVSAYRRQRRAARVAAATAAHTPREARNGWPSIMPGGWPLPPSIPSDDTTTWWPEVDGWPCPPPALRGQA